MKILKFKCELLSEVILNQKAASEGPNKTLDFIPGSCFLGIVASGDNYDKFDKEGKAWEIFHSGKVRCGDAHPSKGDVRGMKIPASMFYPKLKKPSEELYIHHAVPNLDSDEIKKKQLKQCRNGFYTFVNDEAKEVKTETNFAIKSRYDREKRRSKDEQMFGYESLRKGLALYFEVEVETDASAEEIKEALVGNKRVGRSRTAQYGLVEITPFDFEEVGCGKPQNNQVTVYADSLLVFLDDYGLPTCQPTAEQLGLPKGSKIIWEKSQIRTFQYAPWNFKRQCFDTDRCGIEKGSVFVVEASSCPDVPKYVGSYNNEGLGRVIYNPFFLEAEEDGKAKLKIVTDQEEKPKQEAKELGGSLLLNYIRMQKETEDAEEEVYERVNVWIKLHKPKFEGDLFASQWGHIREIAMRHEKKEAIMNELFDKKTERNGKMIPDAYLTHGVAADKWNERGRLKALMDFFDGFTYKGKAFAALEKNAQMALINLAAEMAKTCRKEDN